MEIDFTLETVQSVFQFPDAPPGLPSSNHAIYTQPPLLLSDTNYAPEVLTQSFNVQNAYLDRRSRGLGISEEYPSFK